VLSKDDRTQDFTSLLSSYACVDKISRTGTSEESHGISRQLQRDMSELANEDFEADRLSETRQNGASHMLDQVRVNPQVQLA